MDTEPEFVADTLPPEFRRLPIFSGLYGRRENRAQIGWALIDARFFPALSQLTWFPSNSIPSVRAGIRKAPRAWLSWAETHQPGLVMPVTGYFPLRKPGVVIPPGATQNGFFVLLHRMVYMLACRPDTEWQVLLDEPWLIHRVYRELSHIGFVNKDPIDCRLVNLEGTAKSGPPGRRKIDRAPLTGLISGPIEGLRETVGTEPIPFLTAQQAWIAAHPPRELEARTLLPASAPEEPIPECFRSTGVDPEEMDPHDLPVPSITIFPDDEASQQARLDLMSLGWYVQGVDESHELFQARTRLPWLEALPLAKALAEARNATIAAAQAAISAPGGVASSATESTKPLAPVPAVPLLVPAALSSTTALPKDGGQ